MITKIRTYIGTIVLSSLAVFVTFRIDMDSTIILFLKKDILHSLGVGIALVMGANFVFFKMQDRLKPSKFTCWLEFKNVYSYMNATTWMPFIPTTFFCISLILQTSTKEYPSLNIMTIFFLYYSLIEIFTAVKNLSELSNLENKFLYTITKEK